MSWKNTYKLFLFDFDGLLVNTEHLHRKAYEQLLERYGFKLGWSFPRYCLAAHRSSTGLRDQIYAEFPDLQKKEPDWSVLYRQKSDLYLQLLQEGQTKLLPGVAELLEQLAVNNIQRAVATHSQPAQVSLIRSQLPLLNTIPHWITREQYSHPKPHPECYQKAISQYASEGDGVIGFEDSPRGLAALQGTSAQPVLICPPEYPDMEEFVQGKVMHFASMQECLSYL